MRYLVLGGAGFQGRHLVEQLLKNGVNIRVFDKAANCPVYVGAGNERVEYISGDFNSVDTLEQLVKDVDIVFHLISTTIPKTSNDDPVSDVMSNVIPTIHLLELARKAGVKKVIYFSSGGTVYGVPQVLPIPEGHPTLPLSSYGIHKVAIEHYLHLYFTQYGLDYAVMRVSNPYGAYQNIGRGQGAASVFLYKLMHDEPIEIWGDGSVVRDYIYVSDVINAAIKLVKYEGAHKVFNIGSGKGLTLNELISEIERLVGRNARVNYLPGRTVDVPASVLDISRAGHELDWHPQTSFREGVSQLINSFSK